MNREIIGWWVLPGGGDRTEWQIKFSAYAKPILLHRLCMSLLLG